MPVDRTCAYTRTVQADVWLHREDGRRSSATLIHHAEGFRLEVHDVSVLRGLCDDSSWLSRATELARRRQTVDLCHDGMHLLSLGVLGSDSVSRIGSSDMSVGSWPDARSLLELPPV